MQNLSQLIQKTFNFKVNIKGEIQKQNMTCWVALDLISKEVSIDNNYGISEQSYFEGIAKLSKEWIKVDFEDFSGIKLVTIERI